MGAIIGAVEWVVSDATSGFPSFCWSTAAYGVISTLVMLAASLAGRVLQVASPSWLWLWFWVAVYTTIYVNVGILPRQSFLSGTSLALTACMVLIAGLVSFLIVRLTSSFSWVVGRRSVMICGLVSLTAAVTMVIALPFATSRPDLSAHHKPRHAGELNAVMIVIDTLRADHVSSYGYPTVTTPRIDDLASGGVRFANVYSSSSWTVPAVASLFSGMPLSAHGTGALNTRFTVSRTLAETLSERGIVTVGFSSNPLVSSLYGFDRGFHTFVSYRDGLVSPIVDYAEGTTLGRLLMRRIDGDRLAVDASLRWLEEHREDRFLLYLHLFAPHRPYEPPDEQRDRFVNPAYRGIEFSGAAQDSTLPTDTLRNVLERYDAEIAYADSLVGEVVDCLGRLGISRSTAVIVTSDHGEAFGERGQWEHGRTLYAEETRIPLIFKDPRTASSGVIFEAVSITDLHPTLLSLMDVSSPNSQLGVDLMPAIQRVSAGLPADVADHPVISEILGEDGSAHPETFDAVVMGKLRLIRSVTHGTTEVFNIELDVEERSSLDTAMASALEGLLAPKWWEGGSALARKIELSDEDIRRLRSLGYIR
ncbi:MAG: sulfatase [Candidatus Polarisedimenticolia bacterium]